MAATSKSLPVAYHPVCASVHLINLLSRHTDMPGILCPVVVAKIGRGT